MSSSRRRPPTSIPPYPARPHASGQARIAHRGQTYYLGRHGSPASYQEYARVVGMLTADAGNGGPAAPALPASTCRGRTILIDRLAILWTADATRTRGRDCKEIREVKRALAVLTRLYGRTAAAKFGVPELAAVREAMIDGRWMSDDERAARRKRRQPIGWCRSQVNHMIVRVRTVWRWAELHGHVPPGSWNHLRAMPPLDGRAKHVRATSDREPSTREQLDAALPVAPSPVAAMLEIQWESGMRPGEVCLMQKETVDTAGGPGGCWYYRLKSDKGSWRHDGPPAPVVLNRRCQEIISLWLAAASKPSDYLFPPSRRRRQAHYTEFSYAQAVRRACRAAGIIPFTPYQIRHAFKARMEAEHGEYITRQLMRQVSLESTRKYARKIDTEAAARIVAAMDAKKSQPTLPPTGSDG